MADEASDEKSTSNNSTPSPQTDSEHAAKEPGAFATYVVRFGCPLPGRQMV